MERMEEERMKTQKSEEKDLVVLGKYLVLGRRSKVFAVTKLFHEAEPLITSCCRFVVG